MEHNLSRRRREGAGFVKHHRINSSQALQRWQAAHQQTLPREVACALNMDVGAVLARANERALARCDSLYRAGRFGPPGRDDTRHFRLDRMKEARVTDESFEPRVAPSISVCVFGAMCRSTSKS